MTAPSLFTNGFGAIMSKLSIPRTKSVCTLSVTSMAAKPNTSRLESCAGVLELTSQWKLAGGMNEKHSMPAAAKSRNHVLGTG